MHALTDVSFSVRKGEIHAILGENGAGKSTLVKILMGEQSPDGRIKLEGTAIRQFPPPTRGAWDGLPGAGSYRRLT